MYVSLWHFVCDCSTAFSGCWGGESDRVKVADLGFKSDVPQSPLSLGGFKWISRERQEQGQFVGNANLKLSSTTCCMWVPEPVLRLFSNPSDPLCKGG